MAEIFSSKNTFSLFDKNRDEHISTEDLAAILKSVGRNATAAEIQEMINSIDSNGDGKVDLKEFEAMLAKPVADSDPEEGLKEAFNFFDSNKDGLIDAEELVAALATFGEKVSLEEAKEIVNEADVDGDNLINLEEFIKLVSIPLQHK
ncbi:calmodulin [Zopfochytrium polystomum]|nr:calmodulin [Zopfochytrium polystomum]